MDENESAVVQQGNQYGPTSISGSAKVVLGNVYNIQQVQASIEATDRATQELEDQRIKGKSVGRLDVHD